MKHEQASIHFSETPPGVCADIDMRNPDVNITISTDNKLDVTCYVCRRYIKRREDAKPPVRP